MARYQITIDNLDNVADEPTITVIECTTNYTLREDIAEWIREEIDPEAGIIDVNKVAKWWSQNLRFEMGDNPPIHIYDAPFATTFEIPPGAEGVSLWQASINAIERSYKACRACVDSDHEECVDGNRISAVPYTCSCAINRHGATS